jgi:hypothetical protein
MTNKEKLERQLRSMPQMVRWFSPFVLMRTARQAIDSALFGQYADRRLMQAALDPIAGNVAARNDLSQSVKPDSDGAVWVDFVADLGDGFEPTYAIAYLLSRPNLTIGSYVLPRANVLVMGGDQVYPAATKQHYDERMKTPYEWAFPRPNNPAVDRPKLFLIPGNHDWYDGLVLFLAKFCRGRPTPFGFWQAVQHRSYFALRLPGNWWIWGIDVQLSEDIDAPQAEYFVTVARAMEPNAKIILCSAVPSWLMAEGTGDDAFYRSLDYTACIARDESQNAIICAVLSGDVHHYSRYSASEGGTQFITAGGGGAFLHPTHNLKDAIQAKWVRHPQTLSLLTSPDRDHGPSNTPACYPPRGESRNLLWGNLGFSWRNWEFSVALGLIYWLLSSSLTLWRPEVLKAVPPITPINLGSICDWAYSSLFAITDSPMFLLVLGVLFLGFWYYADAKTRMGKVWLGLAHAVPHLLVILAVTLALPLITIGWWELQPGGILNWFATLLGCLLGGFVGGFIFGLYLLITCMVGNRHCNDAFSAMRSERYKNFLRMRIKGNELTVYAIGLDTPPARSGWRINTKARPGDPSEPVIEPVEGLRICLIEDPIVVAVQLVTPVSEVGSNVRVQSATTDTTS